MRCPDLHELPPPPPGKTGWPWTEDTSERVDLAPDKRTWPKVSIVTPSFNHGPHLEKTIRSVLLQGYPDLEYIVIDGGSKDNTVEILERYAPWLAYWVSEPDRGHGEAINKGAARATGDALVIMPSDDIYRPGGLPTLTRLRGLHEQAVCWSGAVSYVDAVGNEISKCVPAIKDPARIGDWVYQAFLACPSTLIDMDAFRKVGGIDERFHVASDVDLWVRLSNFGEFALTDKEVSEARQVGSSLTNSNRLELTAALIALNYIHGHRDIAMNILARHPTFEEPLFRLIARRARRGLLQRASRIFKGFDK